MKHNYMVWSKYIELKIKLAEGSRRAKACEGPDTVVSRRHRLLGGCGAVRGQNVCTLPRQVAEQAHTLLGRALDHAVAHVEDVVPRARLHQAARDGLADLVLAAKQHHGVHIALLGSG